MAIGSERKNRRVPYEPKGRSSVASAAKTGGRNVSRKGNVKKAAEPKKKASRRKKRKGFSLPYAHARAGRFSS